MTTSLRTALVCAVPLLLAAVGLLHPHHLTEGTADLWTWIHIGLLPVFPLLTVGLLLPVWGRPGRDASGPAVVLVWICSFVYAVFYTALDTIAGIATGALVRAVEGDHEPLVRPLYGIGNELGYVGTYALLLGVLALGAALYLRHGPHTLYGSAVLLASAVSFLDSHIYWPRGGITMLGFAAGFALLVWAVDRRSRVPAAQDPGSAARA
ncbi:MULTISPECIES: hypothetical protein [unclassified Nocardiopsis]|uniref:hypothetical protein n=1 Tax=unclassified Nocardiopsis TaxID=2649073 RepID=UPI001915B4BF|nr:MULTISPECIES: hypothetical protein [unclassified Nocardiopsis]